MANLFSDIVGDNTLWGNPAAAYGTLLGAVSGAAAADLRAAKASFLNTAVNTPVGCTFTLAGETGHIYVGFQPMAYPTDVTAPTPFEGQVAMLIGNDLDNSAAVVLPDASFARCADTHCYEMGYLT